jgi:hypothetical protein
MIRGLTGSGYTVLFISHKLNEVKQDQRPYHGAASGQGNSHSQ